MRSILVVVTAISVVLLACGVAVADKVTTTFEPPTFHTGSVNGQNGWHSAVPGDVPALPNGYDQAVVANTAGAPALFGAQSLRHSNAFSENTGEFEFQTYSRSNSVNAGEEAVPPNPAFVGEFQFTSTSPDLQNDLHMSISPDNGHGGRMSYVSLTDTAAGIAVTFYDTDAKGDFVGYDVPGVYSRTAVHTVRFLMQFVPGGPANDIVHLIIDGVDIGNELGACFTTWESFYRATSQAVPVTNSLQFRSSNDGGDPGLVIPNLVGHGYLFDNVSTDTTPAQGAVPACGEEPPPIDVDKTTQTRSARPGSLVTYRITVRNPGQAPVRALRVCDRPPRALRFVRSTARLRRAAGGRLCLTTGRLGAGQRKTFRVTFRLRRNVTAATVTNGGSVDVPAASAPSPTPPHDSTAAIPAPPRRVIAKDSSRVRVRRTVAPKFTG
jgi:uncharacterized repeat protein (TIGR01451 family)